MESGAGSSSMEELRQRLQRMEKERGALNNTIAELQQDSSDHHTSTAAAAAAAAATAAAVGIELGGVLVLDAFKGLDPSRRCYRLVGGVLVERSVGEVRPALEQHKAKVGMMLYPTGVVLARRGSTGSSDSKSSSNSSSKNNRTSISTRSSSGSR
ncbi:hypothetical protein Emag_004271 [Eimeria magna]